MKSNLVLAGFMGTGKTTVGRIVADRLNMKFVDTDEEVERLAGKSIADVFSRDGETAFREMEAEVCRVLAQRNGQVIATGGGALVNETTHGALSAKSLLICLDSDLKTIIGRLDGGPDRPLFIQDRSGFEKLFAARQKIYASIPLHVDTGNSTPTESAQHVIDLWNQHI